jgi:hypothetical protein
MLGFPQIILPLVVHGLAGVLTLVYKHPTFSTKRLMITFEFHVERLALIPKRKQAKTSRSLWIQLLILHTYPLVYKQLNSYLLIPYSTLASPLTITISKVYLYYFIICMIFLQTNFYIKICYKDCWINILHILSMAILILHIIGFHNNPIEISQHLIQKCNKERTTLSIYINSLEFPKLGSQISRWLLNWNSIEAFPNKQSNM